MAVVLVLSCLLFTHPSLQAFAPTSTTLPPLPTTLTISTAAAEVSAASNLAASADSLTMYEHLLQAQAALTAPSEEEPSTVTSVKAAVRTFIETALHGFFYGFLPAVERRRRSVAEEEKGLLDLVIEVLGSLLGVQDCSRLVACRTGRLAATRVPGAAMVVMMLENMVPAGLRVWFAGVKAGVLGLEDCVEGYRCALVE